MCVFKEFSKCLECGFPRAVSWPVVDQEKLVKRYTTCPECHFKIIEEMGKTKGVSQSVKCKGK